MSDQLDRLPKGWTWASVGDVGRVQLGRQRAPEHHSGPHMRPYLRVANVYEDRIDTSDVLCMNFGPADFDRYKLEVGDILLNEGQSLELVGRAAMYRGEVPDACFQNTLVRFKASAAVLSRYALFLFIQYLHSGRFQKIAKWTTNIAHLGAERFASLEFPLSPQAEQQRIVDALDSYLSRLDDAVASLERVQAKLKAYRASVLKAAVEGRLVPTEAALARQEKRDYEPASVLLERILQERRRRWEEAELARLTKAGKAPRDDKWKAKYEEPQGPDTSKLPKLPEGWCWASASAFYWDAGYGTSEKCAEDAKGPPVLRIPNVVGGRVDLSDLKFCLRPEQLSQDGAVEPGDFVFVRTNGSKSLVGKGALVEATYAQPHYFASYLIRLRLVELCEVARWFALSWHGPDVRKQILAVAASSAGQHNVSLSAAAGFFVALPPSVEQTRILAEIARLFSAVDATEGDISKNSLRINRLRQAVLKWAFEGKLVDQDPNDEPAEKLLARIRAEREAAPVKKGRGRAKDAPVGSSPGVVAVAREPSPPSPLSLGRGGAGEDLSAAGASLSPGRRAGGEGSPATATKGTAQLALSLPLDAPGGEKNGGGKPGVKNKKTKKT